MKSLPPENCGGRITCSIVVDGVAVDIDNGTIDHFEFIFE